MKKVFNVLLIITIVLTFSLGAISTVEARPIDYGCSHFQLARYDDPIWKDSNGIFWDFYLYDYYQDVDESYFYGFNDNTDELVVADSYYDTITSSINFKKGIATFKNAEIDLTVTFVKSNGTYDVTGSRKAGDLTYTYVGPAYIKGAITIDSITYPIEGEISGNYYVNICESHSIVKE
jgi:hypothetical protein